MEYSDSSESEWEEEQEIAAAVLVLEENRKRKKMWVHRINMGRETYGEYHTLIDILESSEESDRFKMYFRMNKEEFNYLHGLVESRIGRISTSFRTAIGTKERLAVCLR